MNKKVIVIISILAFLFIIGSIVALVLANNTSNNNIEIEKMNSQISYLDNEITKMVNMLNNISDDNNENTLNRGKDIDWDSIEKNISKLYSSWNSIIIDFNNLNIKNTSLTDFGKRLDDVTISVKNKDKLTSLSNLCDLYYLLIPYTNSYNSSIELKNNISTKYYLIKAYSLVDTNNWTLISDNIVKAEQCYYNNINSVNIDENNQFNQNKIYVAIKELENITITKDIDLFYFKYSIVMKNFIHVYAVE